MQLQSTVDFGLYTQQEYSNFFSQYARKSDSMEANLYVHKSAAYVKNIDTNVVLISLGQDVWPVSLNCAEYNNALTCSPYTTYVTYPLEMFEKFKAPWVKAALLFNSVFLNVLFRATKINKVVQVNNTFNSLLKHPVIFGSRLLQLNKLFIRKYPKHAILFFRINELFDKALLDSLKKNNYVVFPDRMVHVFDPESQFIKRSHLKRDFALLRKGTYKVVQHEALSKEDVARMWALYSELFVGKHSKHNPHFTKKYFQDAVDNHWHQYVALRNPEGVIDGFISWYIQDGIMICGPLGYDASVSVKAGLYRMSVALALQYAHENNYVFNMGAGSDEFKQNRGSQRVLEYTAVYVKHLRFYRHLPWRLLRFACTRVLPKMFEKEKL